jgi:hypothetical protein
MSALNLMQRLLKKKVGLNEKGPLGSVVKRNKEMARQLDDIDEETKKRKKK